jgi:hypothetical protein
MRAARAVASFKPARFVNILVLQCGWAFTHVPQLQNYMTVERRASGFKAGSRTGGRSIWMIPAWTMSVPEKPCRQGRNP